MTTREATAQVVTDTINTMDYDDEITAKVWSQGEKVRIYVSRYGKQSGFAEVKSNGMVTFTDVRFKMCSRWYQALAPLLDAKKIDHKEI